MLSEMSPMPQGVAVMRCQLGWRILLSSVIKPSMPACLPPTYETSDVYGVVYSVGARGLDIPSIEHVVQLQMAQNAVTHLHRIGNMCVCVCVCLCACI
jgi:hypothetical protein